MFARWLTLILLLIAWGAGVAAVPAAIALIIMVGFVVSTMHASPRPAAQRIGMTGHVSLWLREIATAWLVLIVCMPLERWLLRRDSGPTRVDGRTVLLIHGYINNAGAMLYLCRRLRAAGFGVHTLNLEPVYADIDHYAAAIEERLASISQATGVARTSLVCHSMGGLAARAYLRRHGVQRVAQVVTLGTPHSGTESARYGLGPNARQMVPGNAWLTDLARDEAGAWSCPMTSIYSLDDNIVVPQHLAELAGARNIAVAGIGHISLPFSAAVADLVIAQLSGDTATP